MVLIKKDKAGCYRFSVKATNGKHIVHSVKGYQTIDEIMSIIDIISSGNFDHDIETVNVATKGTALYFTLHNAAGDCIAISDNYESVPGSNPRMAYRIAYNSCIKGVAAAKRYCDKVKIET